MWTHILTLCTVSRRWRWITSAIFGVIWGSIIAMSALFASYSWTMASLLPEITVTDTGVDVRAATSPLHGALPVLVTAVLLAVLAAVLATLVFEVFQRDAAPALAVVSGAPTTLFLAFVALMLYFEMTEPGSGASMGEIVVMGVLTLVPAVTGALRVWQMRD